MSNISLLYVALLDYRFQFGIIIKNLFSNKCWINIEKKKVFSTFPQKWIKLCLNNDIIYDEKKEENW